jgi:hypothetical protein
LADPIATSRQAPHDPGSKVQASGCLLRLIWIALGHILLVFISTKIYAAQSFSSFDLAYWATVAAILGARHQDIHRFQGATASGEPATPEHFRRYAFGVAAAAAVLWVLAHIPSFIGSAP